MQARTGERDNVWQQVLLPDTDKQFSSYYLTVQKQSGTSPTFKSSVIYPFAWSPVWKSDDEMMAARNGATLDIPLLAVYEFGLVMDRQ